MWFCKAIIWQKAKRDLQEAPNIVSILLVVTILTLVWKLPHSAHREFGLCEFWSSIVCGYHLPCRSVLGTCCGKEAKIQISRLLPLFLPSSTLLCIGLKKKAERQIILWPGAAPYGYPGSLALFIIQKEPLYRGRKFYNDCLQDFQQSELMICRDYM